MKKILTGMVILAMICPALPLLGQKITPYNFTHQTDSSNDLSLKMLTEVSIPSSSFLRLFFEGTALGNESYILLEAPDGAQQILRKADLENWNFSSAYFNGNLVKVSLHSGKGEKNTVVINGIKVSDPKTENSSVKKSTIKANATSQSASLNNSNIDYDLLPHAAAVGRFTNGNNSYGTGWIAANGAIVTSKRIAYDYVINADYDIIEFNVPPSSDYGTVNHPAPEDQYPISKSKWEQDVVLFDFKRKHHFDIDNEDNYGDWHTTWAIVEALPNSTGLRPGERQQQYFQVAQNPGSFTIESQNILVDVFHYGEITTDLVDGTQYRTLKRYVTNLFSPEEYLSTGPIDRDDFILYNRDQGDITLSDSDAGAPVTYNQFNVAIGVHNDFFYWAPAVGVGFRNDNLINSLDDFFSSNMTYVDQETYWDASTGTIDKPYHNILEGIEYAAIGGTVNIAKGSYNEPMYVTKAVTLTAPVGTVIIGEGGLSARKASLPQGLELPQEDVDFKSDIENTGTVLNLKTYPNPFVSIILVDYALPESSMVQVKVYDNLGNLVKSLVQESQLQGSHSIAWDGNNHQGRSVTPGIYVVRIETPKESTTMKVIKQ